MPIEDVFSISGRGTVVTGRVERGIVKVGEEVRLSVSEIREDDVYGCGDVPQAAGRRSAGDNVGVLLRGTKREEVERGQVLAVSRARLHRTPSLKLKCMYLSKDEGGRHTPFFKGYRPSFTSDDGRNRRV